MNTVLLKKLSAAITLSVGLLALSACDDNSTKATPEEPAGAVTEEAAANAAVDSAAAEIATATPQVETSVAYEEGVPGGIVLATVDVQATVTAIDKENRMVTLEGNDGVTREVKVGPQVVRFDEINVGDLVKVALTKELVIHLNAAGEEPPIDEAAALVARAPEDAQPGGIAAEFVQVTGTVTAIDTENRTATLQFEDGSSKTFAVRDDIDLAQRKVGEKVSFRVTNTIAINIEKP
jgi:Cu/Ag efflux protein CusF